MRKPLFIFVTDTHNNEYNGELIYSIFEQAISVAIENKLKYIYHGGDFFNERKAQPLSVLKTLVRVIHLCEKRGIILRIIPGNHDKTDYKSEDSFLDIFTKYSNFELIRTYDSFVHDRTCIHMIPFFEEKTTYSKYLDLVKPDPSRINILITHIAVNSVQNNDGSKIENDLTADRFNAFDLVLIGHYHNYQEIDNIVYIGSTHQQNFGEDQDKGYSIIYDDGTFDKIEFENVPTYTTSTINVDILSKKELADKIDLISSQSKQSFQKIKFTGSIEKIASISKLTTQLQSSGIKVEKKANIEIDSDDYIDEQQALNFVGFDALSILAEFDTFAESKKLSDYHKTQGKQLLTKKLVK
jgi:exonuclease SbcD